MPLIPLIAISAWHIVGGVVGVGATGLSIWGGTKAFSALQMRKFRKIYTEGGVHGPKDLEDYFLKKGHAVDREHAERLVEGVGENIELHRQQEAPGQVAQAA